jgi:hypothetical protein
MLASLNCPDLWCVFDEVPYVPAVTILIVPIIAALWLFLIYKYSKAMVWGSVAFNIAIYAFIGLAFLIETDESTLGLMFLAGAALWTLLTYCYRAKVWMAARHLKTACLGISQNLQVYLATGLIQILILLTLGLHWWFMMQAGKAVEVDPLTCVPTPYPEMTHRLVMFQTFALMWIMAWLNYAKLVTTAMVIGGWFFEQQDRPTALGALRISLTSSIPALSSGSVIASLIEFIVQQATSNWWWTDPVGCFLKCLFLCAQSCIMALTRFAMISHAFTGLPFFSASKRVFLVMKRNFAGAYVVSRVGVAVMRTGASCISLCVGLAAWQWLDTELGGETLANITEIFGGMIGTVVFVFVYMWFVKRPLFTILTMSFVMNIVRDLVESSDSSIDARIWFPFAGIFVSCIAMIILTFNGDVVLDSLDTIFLAFGVARDNRKGKPMDGPIAQVYILMESKDVDGVLPTAAVASA